MSKKEEFSQEKHNLEVVDQEKEDKVQKNQTQVAPWEKKNSKQGNVFIGTLNLFTQPFKQRHEKHYKESRFHLIVDTVLATIVLILLAVLVSLFFWKPEQEINLDITHSSDKIYSGQEEVFRFAYAHEGKETIKKTKLSIDLPENFILRRAIPENLYNFNNNTFNLGELTSGANGEVKIAGVILGEPGSRQSISSVFNYQVNNHKMRELSSRGYNIEGSKLNFSSQIPGRVYQGTEFNGSFKLVNNTELDWEEIRIKLSPFHWNLVEVYGEGDYEWKDQFIKINNLKQKEKLNLSFRALNNSSPGYYDFNWEVLGETEEKEFKLKETKKEIEVKKPNLNLSFSSLPESFGPEENIDFFVNFNNKEKEEIKEFYLKLNSGEKSFKLSDFSLIGGTEFKKEGDKIIIGELSPGEESGVKINTSWTRENIGVNQGVSLSVKAEYKIDGQKIRFSQTSPLVKLLSQLKVSSAGYYYSPQGDQLGVGPLPPQVGMATGYWIFWEIDNLGNRLSDVTVSAQLPENVTWTGDKTLLAGKLMHGAVSNKVVWELKEVEAQGGKYKAGFKLNLIPEKKDEGKILDLLRNIEYSAYDQFCEREIKRELDKITTEIKEDKLSSGKSRVEGFKRE